MNGVKAVIIDRVIEEIKNQIKNAERGQKHAIDESKAHKGAMASRYDTFKEEAQYLASGHAVQLQKLDRILGVLLSFKDHPPSITKGSVYAIVEIENIDDGLKTKYFLLPAGGGKTHQIEGGQITVVNVGTPIAQVLIGAAVGDEVEIKIQEVTRHFLVTSVT